MSKNRSDESERKKIGEILVDMGFITPAQLEEAVMLAKEQNIRIGEALFQMGALDHDHFYWALGNQINMNYLQLAPEMIDADLLRSFPIDTLLELNCLPLYVSEDEVHIAISDPGKAELLDRLKKYVRTGKFKLHLALPERITEILERYKGEGFLEKKPADSDKPEAVEAAEPPVSFSLMDKESDYSDLKGILASSPEGTVFKVIQTPSGIHLWRLKKEKFQRVTPLVNKDIKSFLDWIWEKDKMEIECGLTHYRLLHSREDRPLALMKFLPLEGLGARLIMIERLPDFNQEKFLLENPDCDETISGTLRLYRKSARLLIGGPDADFIKQCAYLSWRDFLDQSNECHALFVESNIAMRFPNVIQTDHDSFHESGIPAHISFNPSSFLLYEYEPLRDDEYPFPSQKFIDSWDNLIIIFPCPDLQDMEERLKKSKEKWLGRFDAAYLDVRGVHPFEKINYSEKE